MWNEVVDLLNHKFPDSLNFVSITLYILRNWDKKRTTRRLLKTLRTSRLLILFFVSSNPSLIFKSSIRTNNRTITNQPSRESVPLNPWREMQGCKKDDSFKEASSRNIVTQKSYVVFRPAQKNKESYFSYAYTYTFLIQPRLEIHPSGRGNAVQRLCIFNKRK